MSATATYADIWDDFSFPERSVMEYIYQHGAALKIQLVEYYWTRISKRRLSIALKDLRMRNFLDTRKCIEARDMRYREYFLDERGIELMEALDLDDS